MPEKAILVGTASLDELESLVRTAGAEVFAKVIQKRRPPCPSTYIGRGKAEEIAKISMDADIIVFDDELSGSQVRNLEEIIKKKVIDRTELILDIFAQHAHTQEAKLQVELAQLCYMLPRLRGKGIWLSRLGGGIGTRGPGEKALEIDRRKIKRRIEHLRRKLKEIADSRKTQRKGREDFCTAAIVGYTNTGKSTLLNALCNTEVYVEDKLFATLDPKVGRCTLPNGAQVLLIDTVGFIQKLPHHLVAAFSATLEEVKEADILLHVVDASSSNMQLQIDSVLETLKQLNAIEKPIITVFNKIDKLPSSVSLKRWKESFHPSVAISALKKEGLDELINILMQFPPLKMQRVKIIASVDGGEKYKRIIKYAKEVKKTVEGEKIIYYLLLPQNIAYSLAKKPNVELLDGA